MVHGEGFVKKYVAADKVGGHFYICTVATSVSSNFPSRLYSSCRSAGSLIFTNTYYDRIYVMKNILIVAAVVLVLVGGDYLYARLSPIEPVYEDIDPPSQQVTLSGTYECLPHLDAEGPQTEECAFGFVTDDGVHYAVNFGASADAMQKFQSGAHVTAEGFVVPRDALSTDEWQKYNMKGMFTITFATSPGTPSGKIDVSVVCAGALAYMTFPDGAAAETFIAECKEGKHPEVIERYKSELNVGEGATI